MNRGKGMLSRIYDIADLNGEPIPGLPLIEMIGNQRVLIEYHRGIVAYSQEEICVQLAVGTLVIQGAGLCVCQMTKEQLVISGMIGCVAFRRKE